MEKTPNQLHYLNNNTDSTCCQVYNPANITEQYTALTIQDVKALTLQVKLAQMALDNSQGGVDQAQKNVTLAQKQLDEAVITAPFDGVAITVNYVEGDIVATPSPTQRPVIYLVDLNAMTVNIAVNELDVPKVIIGQSAKVNIDAYPGTKFDGKVSSISPLSTVQGGMVDYSVGITLTILSNVEIRAGMSANAQIIVVTGGTPSAASSQTPTKPTASAPTPTPTGTGSPVNSSVTPSTATALASSSSASVSGSGVVAAVNYANLYFGTGGKIDKIGAKQGERVAKDTILARIDTTNLEAAIAQAKVTLDQAQLAKSQATTALQTIQTTLDKTRVLADAKQEIINLQWQNKLLETTILDPSADAVSIIQTMTSRRTQITNKTKSFSAMIAQAEFTGVLSYDIVNAKYDTLVVDDIKVKELQLKVAQQNVDKAQSTVEQAQKSLAQTQKQLDGVIITAPFDGIVATLNYNAGDMVATPSATQRPVIYLLSTSPMVVNIGVNELDIPRVKIGQPADINIDAFPVVKFQGKVTAVSQIPTVQGGIVDYNVTIMLSVSSNTEIKVGMNAIAKITTR